MFSPESEIFLWIKPKKKKKTFFCGKFGSMLTFRSTRKPQKSFFCDGPTSVWPQGVTKHRIFIKRFFRFRSDFLAFLARISYFKFLEFKEFNRTIITFALVGYETGYSQIGATRLVPYLPSHIQRALMEYLLNIQERHQKPRVLISRLASVHSDKPSDVKQCMVSQSGLLLIVNTPWSNTCKSDSVPV